MNTPRAVSVWGRRRTLIYALLWMGVLLVDGLGLGVLDLIFTGQKADLILADRSILSDFSAHATRFQSWFAGHTQPAVHPQVVQRLNAVIDSPDLLFHGYAYFRFVDPQTMEMADHPELERYNWDKFHARNGFRNCFISRGFNRYYRVPVDGGYLQLYYTTPPQVAGLSALVATFWGFAGVFIALTALFAALVQRRLLRPLLNVSTHLDMPFGAAEAVIPPGRSGLEESYNRLAVNAYRAHLSARLSALLAEAEPTSRKPGEAPAALGLLLWETGASEAALYTLDPESGDLLRGGSSSPTPELPARLPARVFDLAGRLAPRQELDPGPPVASPGRRVLLLAVATEETHEQAALVLLWEDETGARQLDPRLYSALAQALENYLLRARHREMLLEAEKTAVGIHLATHMGHDLTNVIATARWDLATLEKSRERGLLSFNPERGKGAEAALEGLIHDFRLLQEVVELYRAYGYAERPTMAPVDLGRLAENVCDLFRRSTSRRVCLELVRESETAPYVGEARLLALALYNLLSNAVEAVLGAGTREPRVEVRVGPGEEGGWRVSVSDNGPGVRDASGRLLESWEMKTIFSRGYSTKSAAGTGLGLSWVKQIVEEVHHGALKMENLPEGGARACLLFSAAPTSDPV